MSNPPSSPEPFLKDASQCQRTFSVARDAYTTIKLDCVEILSHLSGRKPFVPAELAANEEAYRSNIPYGLGIEKLRSYTDTRAAVLRAALLWSKVLLKRWNFADHGDDPEFQFLFKTADRQIWERVLSQALGRALVKDKAITEMLVSVAFEQKMWGFCPVVLDPTMDTCLLGQDVGVLQYFLEPVDKLSNVTIFIWTQPMSIIDLYRMWLKESGKSSYWNAEGLEEILLRTVCEASPEAKTKLRAHLPEDARDRMFTEQSQWQDVLPFYQTQLGLISAVVGQVRIAKFINREEDGTPTITLWACGTEDYVGKTVGGGNIGTKLLYQRNFPSKTFNGMMHFVRDHGLNTTRVVTDIRGISRLIYEESTSYDIRRNAVNDHLLFKTKWPVKKSMTAGGDSPKMSVQGAFLVTDEEFTINTDALRADSISPLIGYMDFERREQAQILAQHGIKAADEIGDRATKDEVMTVGSEVARRANDAVVMPLSDLEALVNDAILSAIADGQFKDFFAALRDEVLDGLGQTPPTDKKGVEEIDDLLKKVFSSIKKVVLEPVEMDANKLKAQMDLIKEPAARRAVERKMLFALGMSLDELDVAAPELESQSRIVPDNSVAAFENYMFFETREVVFSPGQEHLVHLQAHIGKADQLLQSVQQGEDPVKVLRWIDNAATNITSHLQTLQTYPYQERDFKMLVEAFQGMMKQAQELRGQVQQQVQQMAEQQAMGGQQPQVDPETQAKIERDNLMMQHKQRMTEENSAWRRDLKDREASASQERKAQDHELALAKKQESAVIDLAAKKAKKNSPTL